MSSPDVLDFERLLAPISEEAPAGHNLRRADGSIDPAYEATKTAAQEARTLERLGKLSGIRGDTEPPPAPPNWKKLEQEATRVIETKAKDLWVAAWLIEALVRNHGFAGARDGFRLIRELCERYWDILLPLPDEDDDEHPLEYKLSQLAGLSGGEADGVLIAPLRSVPLIHSDTFGALSLSAYDLAATISAIADEDTRQKRIESTSAATIDDFDKAVRQTPPDQLRSLIEDIRQALDELKKMADVLEAKCQDGGTSYAPSTTALRSVLQECLDCAESFLRQLVPSAGEQPSADSGQAGAGETTTAGSATSGAAAPTGPLRSREDAFRLLLQVADYFRRSEPHSPLSYSLEQAVRWGRQPLPDLLRELISDDAVRAEVYRRTGIPPPPEE